LTSPESSTTGLVIGRAAGRSGGCTGLATGRARRVGWRYGHRGPTGRRGLCWQRIWLAWLIVRLIGIIHRYDSLFRVPTARRRPRSERQITTSFSRARVPAGTASGACGRTGVAARTGTLTTPATSGARATPDDAATAGRNRIHLIVDDLDAEIDRLRGAGLSFRGDTVSGPGGRQILLADPSGNLIELFQPAPRAAAR
jgi:predicted enzyme related to lactoylglutathione lyase